MGLLSAKLSGRRLVVFLGGVVLAVGGSAACTSLLGDVSNGVLTDGGAGDGTTGGGGPDSSMDSPVTSGDDAGGPDGAAADAGDGAPARDSVVQIATGGDATCAVTRLGALYCWGPNQYGAVGDGTTTPRPTAVHITKDVTGATLGPVAKVTAGWFHVCATLQDHSVYCWGNDDNGQLGDGVVYPLADAGVADQHAPQKVPNLIATTIAAGAGHNCVPTGNSYTCWGSNESGELGHTPGTMGDKYLVNNFFFQYANSTPLAGAQVTSSTAAGLGVSLSCANDSTAQVLYCWGGNDFGQLGNPEAGAFAYNPMPAPVPVQLGAGYGLSGRFNEIAAGMGFACALEDTGNMYCWGTAGAGQLGPTIAPSSTASSAIAIDVMDNVAHIGVGFQTVCAIDSLQHVQCWGSNESGELGHDPSIDTPNCSNGPCNANFSTVTADGTMTGKAFGPASGISVGLGFACALKSDGTVWCWGNAAGGRLGNGAEGAFEAGANDAGLTFAPAQVIGLP